MIGALRYFAVRYFAPRYWPKLGAALAPAAVSLWANPAAVPAGAASAYTTGAGPSGTTLWGDDDTPPPGSSTPW